MNMADPKKIADSDLDDDIEIIVEGEDEDQSLDAKQADDDDDDDGDDERPEADQREAQEEGDDGDEVNARQLRRKRQKQRQKETMKKTREENAALLRELQEAKQRLAALETRNVQNDALTAEQRYNAALQQVQVAEAQLKEAFDTGDGEKAIKAQRLREQAMRVAYEADDLRKRLNNPQLQQNNPSLDARTENHAQQWMRENPWFNPAGEDEDSIIARAIDEAWAREAQKQGINPSSEQYWDELDARVKRRLGKTEQPVDRQRRKGPPVTGRGESGSRASTSEKFFLSAERKQALVQAGVWDDPEKRKQYIRRFQEYDRANRA
jgi:hypothetical protein